MSAPDGPAGRTRRTVPAGAFAVVVMVAVALGILAIVALVSDGDDSGAERADDELRIAAGRFTEQFLTYDREDFDAWRAEVLELATGGFAEEFEEAERGLRVFFEEGARDAVAEVRDVFVGQQDRGAVDVVVVYDREVSGGEDEGFAESDRYLQLSLLRIDGEWLVDNVIDVARDLPDTPRASTTTTPPVDPAGG